MADLDDLVAGTQQAIGSLIRKPKMSGKLLRKPPFRFLHDIVFGLGREHGFPDLGMFDESEMVGKAIKDRGAKVAFLEKCIAAVEQASGQQVSMRPNKVVAGLEPELTNEFLQLLAYCVTSGGGGGDDGGGKGPEDDGEDAKAAEDAARREEAERAAAEEEARRRDEEDRRRREDEDRRRADAERAAAEAQAAAAAASKQPDDDGGGGKDGGDDDNPLNGPINVDGSIQLTQALLGRIITKPRLSDKLLSKPPYRFLHDVFMRVGTATGFGEGLLEGDERNGKCKDRNVKVTVLTKCINCVALHLGVHIRARPAKIVAGLEPEQTNEFLQYLAYAATRGDSSEAVQRTLDGEQQPEEGGGSQPQSRGRSPADDGGEEHARAQARAKQEADRAAAEQAEFERQREREERARAQREREEQAAAQAAAAAAARAEEEQRKAKEAAAAAASYGATAGAGAGAGLPAAGPPGGVRRLARPTTARRRPPRVKENVQQMEGAEAKKPKGAVGIMVEGEQSDSDDEPVVAEAPEEKLDGFGAGGGGEGGAGKLTRGILDAERSAAESKKAEGGDDKGKPRKSGIRMGRIKKAGTSGSSYSQVDIAKLRSYIQKLCQSTNPLGKCMDYVLEDIEAMKGELAAWQADYRRRCQDLEGEQEATRDEIVPLQRDLQRADEKIEEEISKINAVKANIAKNDARIQELLRMVVSW